MPWNDSSDITVSFIFNLRGKRFEARLRKTDVWKLKGSFLRQSVECQLKESWKFLIEIWLREKGKTSRSINQKMYRKLTNKNQRPMVRSTEVGCFCSSLSLFSNSVGRTKWWTNENKVWSVFHGNGHRHSHLFSWFGLVIEQNKLMAPDLNKKLEDEVEKYRQTQNGNLIFSFDEDFL